MFGEPIDAYSRAQALADGVLVDVTRQASPAEMRGGFRVPVAITAALTAAIEAIPDRLEGIADLRGRLHDVLWMAASAVRRTRDPDGCSACFRVILPQRGKRRQVVLLRVDSRLDEDGAPCVTIGFPGDF